MKARKFSDLFKIYGSYKAFIILAVALISSASASIGMLHILATILLTGNRLLLGEPNILILSAEVGLMIVAVIFNVILVVMLIRNQITGKNLKLDG